MSEIKNTHKGSKYLTKEELIAELSKGNLPDEYIPTDIGQGYGYKIDKSWEELSDDIVIYIPEYGYDEADNNGIFYPKKDCIYTKEDFRQITKNKGEKSESYAIELFCDVDWSFPETLWDEWEEFASDDCI